MHSKLSVLESSVAWNRDRAGGDCPYTGGAQIAGDWRMALHAPKTWQAGSGHGGVGFQRCVEWKAAWHTLKRWRAGSCHGGGAAKARWTGERRGKHTGLGALGLAIHWRRSNHGRLAGGVANKQDAARLGVPFTGGAQSCVVRGRWLRNLFRYQTRGFSCLWELLRGFTFFWGRTRSPVAALRTPPSPIFPFLGS
jgi:hypothetical protein